MKKFLAVLMVLAMLSGLVAACAPQEAAQPTSAPTEPADLATANIPAADLKSERVTVMIPAPSLEGNKVGDPTEQEAIVYLPPSYASSDESYPVLYFLPGYDDRPEGFVRPIGEAMDSLISEGEAAEFIVVIVNGRNKYRGSFYYNSPVTGNWEDFITQDVVQYIDANYRTVAEPSSRGIAGHSMGGFGVINAVMHTNGVFGYAYAMSPGVFDEDDFAESTVDFWLLNETISKYKDMDESEGWESFSKYIDVLDPNPGHGSSPFTFGYGAAFAGDPDGKPPYIKEPEKDEAGEYLHDDIWSELEAGYGNVAEKLDKYKDNLMSLSGFMIEYGKYDEYEWVINGCEYMSEQMKTRSIPHELVSFSGSHYKESRFREAVLPFFSDAFKGR